MNTCQTASDANPDDEWLAEDCLMVFDFPDDEALIQAEYAKNVPFALRRGAVRGRPGRPRLGGRPDGARPRAGRVQRLLGATQPVAVLAKRALGDKRLRYSIKNGGPTRTAVVSREWNGGERYGDGFDRYIAEYRGTVTGTSAGDSVRVWFTAKRGKTSNAKAGPDFTYQVATDIGGDVLVLAAEDVTGASPVQAATSAKYATWYAADLAAAGYTSDVYNIDAHRRRAPHHLGVLSHYDAVVWETGDDIIPRVIGQPGGTAAPLALDLELTVRDYLDGSHKALRRGQVQPVRPGGGRRVLVQPVRRLRSARRRTRTRACRCSTTSSSTGWGPTTTSTARARTRTASPFLSGWRRCIRRLQGRPSTAPGRRTNRTSRQRS